MCCCGVLIVRYPLVRVNVKRSAGFDFKRAEAASFFAVEFSRDYFFTYGILVGFFLVGLAAIILTCGNSVGFFLVFFVVVCMSLFKISAVCGLAVLKNRVFGGMLKFVVVVVVCRALAGW